MPDDLLILLVSFKSIVIEEVNHRHIGGVRPVNYVPVEFKQIHLKRIDKMVFSKIIGVYLLPDVLYPPVFAIYIKYRRLKCLPVNVHIPYQGRCEPISHHCLSPVISCIPENKCLKFLRRLVFKKLIIE